jgi:hypothetical protein
MGIYLLMVEGMTCPTTPRGGFSTRDEFKGGSDGSPLDFIDKAKGIANCHKDKEWCACF